MSTRPPSSVRPGRGIGSSAEVFAALGDRRRLRILGRLAADGPLSITRLAAGTDVSRQAVTKHLDVLSEAGLVHDERRGRERLFELDAGSLERARNDLDAISAQWDRAVGRLREHLEG